MRAEHLQIGEDLTAPQVQGSRVSRARAGQIPGRGNRLGLLHSSGKLVSVGEHSGMKAVLCPLADQNPAAPRRPVRLEQPSEMAYLRVNDGDGARRRILAPEQVHEGIPVQAVGVVQG